MHRVAAIGVVAVALSATACIDLGDVAAPPRPPTGAVQATGPAVVATPPPADAGTSPAEAAATVLVVSTGGVDDPGLDATVATLRQRPDLHVEVIASGESLDGTTASGFPAAVVPVDPATATAMGIETAFSGRPDLVVVAMGDDDAAPMQEAMARTAVAHGVSAVAVRIVGSDGVLDYGAGGVHLLDALDTDLGGLLFDDDVRGIRLSVPSCSAGSLRGRVEVDATPVSEVPIDCVADRVGTPANEAAALAAGFVTVVDLG